MTRLLPGTTSRWILGLLAVMLLEFLVLARHVMNAPDHAWLMNAVAFDLSLWCGLGLWVAAGQAGGWDQLPVPVGRLRTALMGTLVLVAAMLRLGGASNAALMVLELGVLTILVSTVVRGVRQGHTGMDALARVQHALGKVLPPVVAHAVVHEGVMLWMAWRALLRRPIPTPGVNAITFTRSSSHGNLALALGLATLVEMPAVHILMHHVWGAAALPWHAVSVGLHIYALLWLAGDVRWLRETSHQATAAGLHLHLGGRMRVLVPWSSIQDARVESLPAFAPYARMGRAREHGMVKMTPLESPNVVLQLSEPVDVVTLVGTRRGVTRLRLFVDEPATLVTLVRASMPPQG